MGETRRNLNIRKSTYEGIKNLARSQGTSMSEALDAWVYGTSFGLVGSVAAGRRRKR